VLALITRNWALGSLAIGLFSVGLALGTLVIGAADMHLLPRSSALTRKERTLLLGGASIAVALGIVAFVLAIVAGRVPTWLVRLSLLVSVATGAVALGSMLRE
jgi:hypothetical protein